MTYYAYGIDYTGGLSAATIDRATIDGHQIGFVCRYLSGFSKDLTPAEAQALSAAGTSIVVVFETTAAEAENGHAAGVRDATAALAEAKRCGMPDGRPIYMAVDEDTTVGPHITAYFQGVASVLGLARTGAYGGYHVIKALFDAGLITWGWQTYAWSGGAWDSRGHIQQYSNDHTLSGAGVDYDRAIKSDFGQWRIGVTPSPQPVEDDMAAVSSVGANSGQQIPASNDASIQFSKVYSDKHNFVTPGSDGKAYSVYPDGDYWAVGDAIVELHGLKPGDAADVAWTRMVSDGKGGWKVGDDAWRVTFYANAQGVVRAALNGQFGVGKTDPVRVRVYNPNGYPLTVQGAMAKLALLKY